jgi:pimeloyl-ACP methyl ester carboxylesterase
MAHVTTDDGVKLYYEEAGEGLPIVFVHEFGGDYRSFEPQMRYFARSYRCVTYSARGYPPSDIPEDVGRYSQDRAVADILAVIDGLKLERAHVVGVSMGALATLHFALRHPGRARSAVLGGCGSGSAPGARETFQNDADATAARFDREGMAPVAAAKARAGNRVQFIGKDPRGFAEFERQYTEHSALGSRNTQLGVQRNRPSLYDFADAMTRSTVPTLILSGDEDEPCLEPSLYMKRLMPLAGLAFFPKTGHVLNLEEPDLFNRHCADFFHRVELGRGPARDPRAKPLLG